MSGPGSVVWQPTDEVCRAARVTDFSKFVERTRGQALGDYDALWSWSVSEIEEFWSAISEYFGVEWRTPYDKVLSDATMPGASWFNGGALNFVDQVFREPREGVALVGLSEHGARTELSWVELERQVGALAATLRSLGVGKGDAVVGYLADVPQAIVAFLATASIGAVWASCAQDLAAPAALDRFAQLEPKVLFATCGYSHRGKRIDRTDDVADLAAGLNLEGIVGVDAFPRAAYAFIPWSEATSGQVELVTETVDADHPLWVLFSSGTTGLPKGIVHSHGGVVVEHLKTLGLHLDLGPESTFYWYTTLSWMMWNFRNSGLLVGATVVCFDGTPTSDAIWSIAERERVTALGVSPGFLAASRKEGVAPAADYNLSALKFLGSTGSVLPADVHEWVAQELGSDVLVGSTTGGTDIVSGFAGSIATMPVVAGEIAVRCLGVDLQAWAAEGTPVIGQVGELVVLQPMPSMPVRFWLDPDGEKYRAAYFETYPGVWRHGDWITVTDRGSLVIHGRSDATLNRNGVRMGSADIYRVAESIRGVTEALVVGIEEADGGYWMPMFVTVADDQPLTDELVSEIKALIKSELSPRHVPDEIIKAPGIPHTLTGKKVEVPVKRVLASGGNGVTMASAIDRPELLEWYAEAGRCRLSSRR